MPSAVTLAVSWLVPVAVRARWCEEWRAELRHGGWRMLPGALPDALAMTKDRPREQASGAWQAGRSLARPRPGRPLRRPQQRQRPRLHPRRGRQPGDRHRRHDRGVHLGQCGALSTVPADPRAGEAGHGQDRAVDNASGSRRPGTTTRCCAMASRRSQISRLRTTPPSPSPGAAARNHSRPGAWSSPATTSTCLACGRLAAASSGPRRTEHRGSSRRW